MDISLPGKDLQAYINSVHGIGILTKEEEKQLAEDYYYNGEETVRFIIQPMHKHFHSQSCMKEWIARHSQSFSHLVDSLSHNVIEDKSNQEKG